MDLIERQAAIDVMLMGIDDNWEFDYAVDRMKELPSVQPERKRGKWIDAVLPNDNGGLPVQVCDQCNTFFPLAYTGGGHHFCPNCGADMREDTDDQSK